MTPDGVNCRHRFQFFDGYQIVLSVVSSIEGGSGTEFCRVCELLLIIEFEVGVGLIVRSKARVDTWRDIFSLFCFRLAENEILSIQLFKVRPDLVVKKTQFEFEMH